MIPEETRWFPSKIKPKHVGIYKTIFGNIQPRNYQFSYWDGSYWSDSSNYIEGAEVYSLAFVKGAQHKSWKGLLK